MLHCCIIIIIVIIIITLTVVLFNIIRKDNTDFMYLTLVPGVLGNNH